MGNQWFLLLAFLLRWGRSFQRNDFRKLGQQLQASFAHLTGVVKVDLICDFYEAEDTYLALAVFGHSVSTELVHNVLDKERDSLAQLLEIA